MKRLSHRDMRTCCLLLCIPFTCIIGRLAYLQIYQQMVLLTKSMRNYLRSEYVRSPRGGIVDYKGRLLATNRPIIHLLWQGSGNARLTERQKRDIERLELLVEKSFPWPAIERAERCSQSITLSEHISFELLSILVEQFPDHQNIMFSTTFERFYPYGTYASHVLGHISHGSSEQKGSMGIEKACDMLLQGIPGQMLYTVNAQGKQVAYDEVQRGRTGEAISTTLDIELQAIAEASFPEGKSGVFIAMEAATGALRVVMSRPNFDPNLFTRPISFATWEQMLHSKALLNRAFLACYPPASLFKLVVIIAALDTKIIGPQESWHCVGFTTFHGKKYSCMRSVAHGHVTIEEMLAQSCNIPFFDIGRRIKINTLAHYATLLGLGVGTDSIIGEKLGIIPSTQWKMATLHEPWWPGETLSATIGQTFLLVPPIQICRMIGTICEGFSVTPHLLSDTPLQRTPVPIAPGILARIKQSMKWVVTRGTGHALSSFDMELFAKTGTAQTRNKTGKTEIDEAAHSHGWFAMHVTYKDEPSLVIVILVEQVESSRDATRVAKQFLRGYKKWCDTKQNVTMSHH